MAYDGVGNSWGGAGTIEYLFICLVINVNLSARHWNKSGWLRTKKKSQYKRKQQLVKRLSLEFLSFFFFSSFGCRHVKLFLIIFYT